LESCVKPPLLPHFYRRDIAEVNVAVVAAEFHGAGADASEGRTGRAVDLGQFLGRKSGLKTQPKGCLFEIVITPAKKIV